MSLEEAFKQRETELIQVYIKERKNQGKLGVMVLVKRRK